MGSLILERIVVATTGCRGRTMERQSAQFNDATGLVQMTFRRALPPGDRGIRTVGSVSKDVWIVSGLTIFNMQFARPVAQCRRRAHADSTSSTIGMRRQQLVVFFQEFSSEAFGRSLGSRPPAFPRCRPLVLSLQPGLFTSPSHLGLSIVRSVPDDHTVVVARFQLRSGLEFCQCGFWNVDTILPVRCCEPSLPGGASSCPSSSLEAARLINGLFTFQDDVYVMTISACSPLSP